STAYRCRGSAPIGTSLGRKLLKQIRILRLGAVAFNQLVEGSNPSRPTTSSGSVEHSKAPEFIAPRHASMGVGQDQKAALLQPFCFVAPQPPRQGLQLMSRKYVAPFPAHTALPLSCRCLPIAVGH